jgi:hypothetical protein
MTEGENAVCQDELTPIIKEMTNPKNLNAIYQDLKNTYFPGWDQGNAWRIRARNRLSDPFAEAICDIDKKTIDIIPQCFLTVDHLQLTIIHEICHAVLPKRNHASKLFHRKLFKAAEHARELGQQSLSEGLFKDVRMCQAVAEYEISKRDVLDQIEQLLKQDMKPLKVVIETAANDWGLDSDQLLKKYPTLMKDIRKMKRDIAKGIAPKGKWE